MLAEALFEFVEAEEELVDDASPLLVNGFWI